VLKILINEEFNYSSTRVIQTAINGMRSILDQYSIREFVFSKEALGFKDSKFIDNALDSPESIILEEIYLHCPDNVNVTIERSDCQLKAIIMGENRGVMSTYRLINAINKIIKGNKIQGKLSDDVDIKKLIKSHFEGEDFFLIDVTRGEEDKQECVFVSYINILEQDKIDSFLNSLKDQIMTKKSSNSKKSPKPNKKKFNPPIPKEQIEASNHPEIPSSSDSD
jgi:hypothetical protein